VSLRDDKKYSFRPGVLAGPMEARLTELGDDDEPLGVSEYLRRLVAADCGVKPPAMPEGNPAFRKQKKSAKRKR
jgi:hypothetical protein